MALQTLDAHMPGPDLIRENTEPLVTLEADPLTQALAAPFQTLQDDLIQSLTDENNLLLAVARAEAKARKLDAQIDALVIELKHASLVITNNDTTREPYATYFKDQQPAEVTEPLLGDELDTVAAWVSSLEAQPYTTLKDISTKLGPLVALGDPAMKAMRDANQALVDFFEVGGRYLLVQKMNSARKITYGQLGQIVHDHPELALPKDWPDRFFLHEARQRKETPASIDAQITALKKKIDALQIKRDKLVAVLAAQTAASAKKKNAKLADEIAKAEKDKAEADTKLASLKAEAEKTGP